MGRSATQSVFTYGMEGHNLLSETTRNLSTSALLTTEHIYLPTASGPMPVAVVIGGVHYAVHSDHLNTPRRLSDANKVVKWQWPYSGFGEIAPQATPATGQAAISYSLRYPGQIDDGNGLFYNWNRFYDPRVGRYTQADPIGLEGGWNRYSYVGGNPISKVDPTGLQAEMCAAGLTAWCPAPLTPPPSSPPPTAPSCADCDRAYEACKRLVDWYPAATRVVGGLLGGGAGKLVGNTTAGAVGSTVGGTGPQLYEALTGMNQSRLFGGCEAGYKRCTAKCKECEK